MKTKRRNSVKLSGDLKMKLLRVSDDLSNMSKLLQDIATEEVEAIDGKWYFGYTASPDTKTIGPAALKKLAAEQFLPLVSKAFKDRKVSPEEMHRVYLCMESPAIMLMRDVLEIPDEIFIEPGTFDDDAIWEFVKRHTKNDHEYFVLTQKYGESTDGFRGQYLQRSIIDVTYNAQTIIGWTVTPARVLQVYHSAIHRLRHASKSVLERKKLIQAMFGVDIGHMARDVFCLVDFLKMSTSGKNKALPTTDVPAGVSSDEMSADINTRSSGNTDKSYDSKVAELLHVRLKSLGLELSSSDENTPKADESVDEAGEIVPYEKCVSAVLFTDWAFNQYTVQCRPDRKVIIGDSVTSSPIRFKYQNDFLDFAYDVRDYVYQLKTVSDTFQIDPHLLQDALEWLTIAPDAIRANIFNEAGEKIMEITPELISASTPLLEVITKYGCKLIVDKVDNTTAQMYIDEFINMAGEEFIASHKRN